MSETHEPANGAADPTRPPEPAPAPPAGHPPAVPASGAPLTIEAWLAAAPAAVRPADESPTAGPAAEADLPPMPSSPPMSVPGPVEVIIAGRPAHHVEVVPLADPPVARVEVVPASAAAAPGSASGTDAGGQAVEEWEPSRPDDTYVEAGQVRESDADVGIEAVPMYAGVPVDEPPVLTTPGTPAESPEVEFPTPEWSGAPATSDVPGDPPAAVEMVPMAASDLDLGPAGGAEATSDIDAGLTAAEGDAPEPLSLAEPAEDPATAGGSPFLNDPAFAIESPAAGADAATDETTGDESTAAAADPDVVPVAAPTEQTADPVTLSAEPTAEQLASIPVERDAGVPAAAVAAGALVSSAASPETAGEQTAAEVFAHAHDDVEARRGVLSLGLLTKLAGVGGLLACTAGLAIMLMACAGMTTLAGFPLLAYGWWVMWAGVYGLGVAVVGGLLEHRRLREETHVLAALFTNALAAVGGLLIWAAFNGWRYTGGGPS